MVHWPEVMMTYEEHEHILFSADAFGSFGALNGHLFDDEIDFGVRLDGGYAALLRQYRGQIRPAGPGRTEQAFGRGDPHGVPAARPVWRSGLDRLLDKYRHWSTYTPEERSVAVFYGSMYGDTENAVNILTSRLAEAGVKNIAVYDVSSTHVSTMIAEVFRCSHLVLAAPTYNNGVYPAMLNLLHDMKALNLQNRTVALMENGSWAPSCARQMRALLEEMKSMEILEPVVTLKSALKDDSLAQLDALRDALIASLMAE